MKTMRLPTLRPLIQATAIVACLAGTLHAALEYERIYFNGKDFKGGQLIVPKTSSEKVATIKYLDETNWRQDRLLYGANDIAALTFCSVPISAGAK